MQQALKAGIAYFAIVFAAGFLLGTLRVMALAPLFGETAAVLLELPVMLAVSWVACRWSVRKFAVPPQPAPRLLMGASAFVLLMIAEALLAIILFKQSPAQFLAGFGHLAGQLGLAGQLAFAAMPAIEGLLHRR
jgi:hypothetical protein